MYSRTDIYIKNTSDVLRAKVGQEIHLYIYIYTYV